MVESPCIGVCSIKNGVCVGCARTQQEISTWMYMTDWEKQQVLNRIFDTESSNK